MNQPIAPRLATHGSEATSDQTCPQVTPKPTEDRTLGDRHQHEIELLSNQSCLEAFFAHSPDGFFFMMLDLPIQWDDTVDKETILDHVFNHQTVTRANAAMLAQYDAATDEFVGLTPKDFFAHDLATGRDLWRRMFDQGRLHVETLERKLDGTTMWIEGDYNCLYESDGKIIGHFGIQRDITGRKQTEENLEQFNKALSHAMEGVALLDLQGHYIQVNHAYANMLGYLPEAMIGMDWQLTVHLDDLAAMQLAYQDMLLNGKVEVEARGIRIDGSIFYKQLVMVTAYDLQQQLIGHYCFMKNISDRKLAETQLRQQEEFLQSIYDGTEQAIFVIDITPEKEFRYAGFNPVSEKYAGVTNEQIQGKTAVEAFGETFGTILQQNYQLCLQAGRSINYEEQLKFDTHTIWTLTTLSPLQDEQGRIYRIIGTATDISDRKYKEIELQNQKQDLARSNAELQQFAYIASHDLQEPLRMITSYLELLERRYKGQLDEKADKFIAYAVDGATRMQTLINDLLSYSRVGSRSQDLELVDCEKILQNVLTNLQMAIKQNNAIITHTPLPRVSADPSQLTQLFQNLISNSIKFRREDPPQIHLEVQDTDGKWLFTLQDNGIGMEVQYLERIFIIFQRLHSKTEYPGTGIGLAVCKKIVERHGGNLWVESQHGQGSTFYFTIPHAAGNLP
jgi:PAS domain S-box-containing protein